MESHLEEALLMQIRATGLPAPVTEYRFAPPRRWRFDLAWPDLMLAVEVEGAVWARGRHTRGAGYSADVEKYNAAVMGGWRLLRFTGDMIADGQALDMITKVINGH